MKVLLPALLSFASIAASAQTDSRIFFSQLMVVFSDLDKNFEFLKGEQKGTEASDTLFESNLALEGTKENTILCSANSYAYQAMISDSTSEEGSQLILKAWKEKLTGALGDSFHQPAAEFQPENNPGVSGYLYASEKVRILLLRHKTDEGWCWINLVIQSK